MIGLALHEFHGRLGARFAEVGGAEVVRHYGDWLAEHTALRHTAGVLDLSFRSRLWIRGPERQRFLNGQVTNQVTDLRTGQGCYAVVTDPKGKMQSDLQIHSRDGELLLDFEPGLTPAVWARLQRYVLGRGVQLMDAAHDVGLLSIQGPKSLEVVQTVLPEVRLPAGAIHSISWLDPALGSLHVVNHPRLGRGGFDCFVPGPSLSVLADRLVGAARNVGGIPCGWQAMETTRIEQGIPRFGADMDETNLPPEAGIEARAVSYTKGCYVGQEVVARLQSRGQVAKALRGLRLADELPALPSKGDKLMKDGKDVGYVTSATRSPAFGASIALGYVRREVNEIGADLILRTPAGESQVRIVEPPRWA